MIILVTFGLSFLDVKLALTLGAIMLVLMLLLPVIFYRAGKPAGRELTALRSNYRMQLTSWLRGSLNWWFSALSRGSASNSMISNSVGCCASSSRQNSRACLRQW